MHNLELSTLFNSKNIYGTWHIILSNNQKKNGEEEKVVLECLRLNNWQSKVFFV